MILVFSCDFAQNSAPLDSAMNAAHLVYAASGNLYPGRGRRLTILGRWRMACFRTLDPGVPRKACRQLSRHESVRARILAAPLLIVNAIGGCSQPNPMHGQYYPMKEEEASDLRIQIIACKQRTGKWPKSVSEFSRDFRFRHYLPEGDATGLPPKIEDALTSLLRVRRNHDQIEVH